MKSFKACLVSVLGCVIPAVLCVSANAIPLNSSARAVVPADLQQLISVDYRALKDSSTAMKLKEQVLPENLKQFESALKSIGIDPEKDVDSLSFASFRTPKMGVKAVGVAAGSFSMKTVLKKITAQKIKPKKYRMANLYDMDGGMVMSFLDESTLLFGDLSAVKFALDTRDGEILNVDTNATMADMMSEVDSSPVWSILDQLGTQNVMRSALGDAAKITDYDTIKKRLLGSRYTMNFTSGVNFDLTVVSSDSVSAATLSSLVKAGLLYKKMNASAAEKVAMDNTSVDSDGPNVQFHFKSSDQQFQSLMHSELFAAVSH
ncbi:MAG TPA: hypothetical protein VFE08_03545 [Candidatus Sulfotelmatobacter sp.]|jgi:hypothetical protein|nr:hypothetical protein [Candidatus Sulfotelmatobacter sp.]